MHRLIEFLSRVPENNWCVAKWCTTCGHRDFAFALVQLERPPDLTVETMMGGIPFADFASLPNWSDYLVSIFNRRRGPRERGLLSEIERESVLFRWHERLVQVDLAEIYFVDHVLFHPVRGLRSDSEAVTLWFDLGVRYLRETRDFSLAETMVYFGGSHPRYKPQILKLLNELALTSAAIRHAFTQVKYPK